MTRSVRTLVPRGVLLASAFIAVVVFGTLSQNQVGAVADAPDHVSMIQLISTPERYQGKLVRLVAYLHLEFEGNGLYLHREDYVNGLTKNGIWIDIAGTAARSDEKLQDHYVIAEGSFDGSSRGHFGMYAGTLKNVRRLQPWR